MNQSEGLQDGSETCYKVWLGACDTAPKKEGAELKMLRFSLGVSRRERIRNDYIRGAAQAEQR